jgi:uncharacterized protein (DUF433 family)
MRLDTRRYKASPALDVPGKNHHLEVMSPAAAIVDIGSLITQTPGICGGRPRIAGTGVSVRRVVVWHKLGLTPEEIADRIGHLSLAQVHAGLAYYHANRGAIEADLASEGAEADRLEREHTAAGRPR